MICLTPPCFGSCSFEGFLFKGGVDGSFLGLFSAIFEGLKAFAWKDGSVNIFRPQENAKRLAMSAERLLMPKMEEERFVSKGFNRIFPTSETHKYFKFFGDRLPYFDKLYDAYEYKNAIGLL